MIIPNDRFRLREVRVREVATLTDIQFRYTIEYQKNSRKKTVRLTMR